MTVTIYSFLHFVFLGFVALFPPVNPIGTAFLVEPFFKNISDSERRSASIKIAAYSTMICLGTLVIGSWVFKLFGISLPIVQVAGGIMICRMGWQFLSTDNQSAEKEPETTRPTSNLQNYLFYPLAFPMTTGAGTISVLLTLSARSHSENVESHLSNLAALAVAVMAMTFVVYLSYRYTPLILRQIGTSGGQIVNRLSSFLVFCVGLQIAMDGIQGLGLFH